MLFGIPMVFAAIDQRLLVNFAASVGAYYSTLKASDTLFDCCRDRLHDQPAQLRHRLQEEERGGIGRGRGGADGKRTK